MSPRGKRRHPVTGVVVYQRRGSKWWYRVELERDVLTGERRWEYKGGFNSDEDAWAAAMKAKADIAGGQRVTPSKLTVAGFLQEWLDAVRHSLKPSTYASYVDIRDDYVVPKIGRRRLQSVDVPTLNALYVFLLTSGRCKPDTNSVMYEYWSAQYAAGRRPTAREVADQCSVTIHASRKAINRYRRGRIPVTRTAGLAPKTVKNVHRMIHRALGDAVAWRYIEYNPAEHASLPRERRKRRRRPGQTWTPEQLSAWLKVATQDRDAALWVLVATTGMRRSELAGAERDLVDLDAGVLDVADTRVVVDGAAEESDGKSESGNRTISLDPFTVSFLRRHIAMLDEERAAFGNGYADQGKLFCHPDGRPIHPDTITRRFNRLVDVAGVPQIRLHDVRHTYATVSLDAGINPKIVSERIGHANMAYTLQIYTHKTTGRDRAAAEQVATLIFGDGWEPPA